MEKTEWFPGDVKPVRKGVYETLDRRIAGREELRFQYWNGDFWGGYVSQIVYAKGSSNFHSTCRSPKWRGLKEKPE